MKIFPKLQRHIDAALADPKQSAQPERDEDLASEARAEVTTPKGGQR